MLDQAPRSETADFRRWARELAWDRDTRIRNEIRDINAQVAELVKVARRCRTPAGRSAVQEQIEPLVGRRRQLVQVLPRNPFQAWADDPSAIDTAAESADSDSENTPV
jgi:hypothetical protein